MNFFFFLDNIDPNLSSSVEVFNRPSAPRLCKDNIISKNIFVFYSDSNKWVSKKLASIKPFESVVIHKKDLPKEFQKESVFICLSSKNKLDEGLLINENYMNSSPAWRANTKIYSKNSSVSYQAEYPYLMTFKKLSLVSCSPMLQKGSGISSFFILVNLKNLPEQNYFNIKVMTTDKKSIKDLKFKTNSINIFNMDSILNFKNNLTYVFNSDEEGGIPIYFSQKGIDFFSLEHTHPPTEYTFEGNRLYFQKKKKSFWSI